MRFISQRSLPWLLPLACTAVLAAGLNPGGSSEFRVELPPELRTLAGRGQVSPVTHALVTVVLPANFDTARDWPVLIVNATSVPQYHSSRALLRAYAAAAVAQG